MRSKVPKDSVMLETPAANGGPGSCSYRRVSMKRSLVMGLASDISSLGETGRVCDSTPGTMQWGPLGLSQQFSQSKHFGILST
jgi:hypothetical protein